MSIFVRILIQALAAYVNLQRVRTNDKIFSDTYESALSLWDTMFDRYPIVPFLYHSAHAHA